MILIKKKSNSDYLVFDAILIIIEFVQIDSVSRMQFELLRCGIMIQQPLLRDVLKEMKEKGAITNDFQITSDLK